MKKVQFAHIAPVGSMNMAEHESDINLVLAHLVGDNEYTKFYANSDKVTIMDNGAFELGQSYEPAKLIELAKLVNADYIVLPDYPGEHQSKTIEAANIYIPLFKDAGFKVFFVPQALPGDINGLLEAWDYALNNPDIDLIGNSILAAPNAFGKMHSLESRFRILRDIAPRYSRELLSKRIHMLGMLDTVHEICLCRPFHWMINSWDSSAAVWYGLNGLDVSEQFVKFKKEVDFSTPETRDLALRNILYVNSLL